MLAGVAGNTVGRRCEMRVKDRTELLSLVVVGRLAEDLIARASSASHYAAPPLIASAPICSLASFAALAVLFCESLAYLSCWPATCRVTRLITAEQGDVTPPSAR